MRWSVRWRSVSWQSVAGSQYVNGVVRVAVLVRCTLVASTFGGRCTLEVALVNAVSRVAVRVCCTLAVSKLAVSKLAVRRSVCSGQYAGDQ